MTETLEGLRSEKRRVELEIEREMLQRELETERLRRRGVSVSGYIYKRADIEAAMESLAEEMSKANPEMSPQQAYQEAMSSERGMQLRGYLADMLPEHREPVGKVCGYWEDGVGPQSSAFDSPSGQAVISKVNLRADEIARAHPDLTPQQVYRKAMAAEHEAIEAHRESGR